MTATGAARALVAALVAAGVRDVVISPGSRSAPLAYAVAAAERAGWVRAHVRLDERGGAFFAVGLARAALLRGRAQPVAVITTSGTAVANLHPGVLEASHAGLPLVVVSADRPHEWRGTGANQTTSQAGIFGDAVRAALDMPAGFPPASVRGHVTRLVAAACGTLTRDPGPVHLNVGLREPLTAADPWAPGDPPAPVALAGAGRPPALRLPAGRPTLVVAGDGAGPVAADVARAAGWPLLAEPTSAARLPGALTHHVALLAAGLGERAERVVVFGHPTLSRPVAALLTRRDLEVVVVSPGPRWTDVAGVATAVTGAVEVDPPEGSDRAWQETWRRADAEMEAAWQPSPLERVVRELWATPAPLLLGSSTTVRAFDVSVPPAAVRAVANRGLAGIDGTLATAGGLATGLGEPVRAVVGDLTFLHDVGSLGRGAAEPAVGLQVVVLNDHGGGIFAGLEHAAHPDADVFRRFFTTPQEVDLEPLVQAYGGRHARVEPDQLRAALHPPGEGLEVIEVLLTSGDFVAARQAALQRATGIVRRLTGSSQET